MRPDGSWHPVLLWITAILLALGFHVLAPVLEVPDSASYLAPARSWARGDGLLEADGSPMSYRMPAFPLVVGIGIRLSGDPGNLASVSLTNFVCLLLTALLTRRAIRSLGAPDLADLGGAVCLLYPPLLTSTALVLQETLLTLFVTLLFSCLVTATKEDSWGPAGLAGAALGLTLLTKPVIAPTAPLLLLLLAATQRNVRKRVAAFCLLAALVVAPWAIRNAVVLGRIELAPGNTGHTLLGGTVSNQIDDWYGFDEYESAARDWAASAAGADTLDRHLTRVALHRIAQDPARWARLCLERVGRFMLPSRVFFVQAGLSRTGSFGPLYVVASLVSVALFALTLFVGGLAWRRRDPALAVGPVLVLGHVLVYAATYVSPRYALPITPALIACAAWAAQVAHESSPYFSSRR
ncbi:MAG: glycosyltransferase family 39 protein [Vicinamibacteria bacterium]|nr:glycosyltransferase family 39 protein [Vicinamibacteria bacterium]